jgi:hypothetical protein
MERVRVISHRDKQVLLVDMTDCTPNDALEISDKVQTWVTTQPKDSVLILVDLTGARFDKNALDRMKKVAAYDKPHVKRSAMVGGGAQQKFLKQTLKFFSQRDYASFETKEEALDWLVS